MSTHDLPGGTYRVDDLALTRVGYGAMQLAGPGVFGPPKDRDEAIAVLRAAVDLGITHVDTADFYGPHVTNEIPARRSRPTRTSCTSSPKSAPFATTRAGGRPPSHRSSCARRSTTTCAPSGSTCWTW
jgi:aryl-alcohol dehydrogenase-like predicted oxidoreductase